MPRPIFAHKLHLTRVGQASSTVEQSPASAASARWYAVVEQNGFQTTLDSFAAAGGPTVNSSPAQTSVQESDGSYIRYTTGTADNALGGWTSATNIMQIQLLPDLVIVMKTGASANDVTDVRIWMGLSSSGTAIDVDSPTAISSLLFRFNPPGGDTTWYAVTSNGAAATAINTGVSVTADTRYVLRIKAVSTSSVEYYINGTLVATATATLPAAATNLRISAFILNNLAGTTRAIKLRKYYMDAL